MGTKKRGPGRPPKPPYETKPDVFQIRLAAGEKANWQAAAERAKQPLAAWIRERLNKAATREMSR